MPTVEAQHIDTVAARSSAQFNSDSAEKKSVDPLQKVLKNNLFINTDSIPVASFQQKRNHDSREGLFYQVLLLLVYLGILKTAFNKYFVNMIRVFFNTSLRQSQLTDQLLIAKLPSLFYNILFVLTSGYYIYFVLINYRKYDYSLKALLICFAIIMIIYSVKYFVLKFTGWLTGYKKEADDYIFIVFLVNKILGLLLVPFIVIIAFAEQHIVNVVLVISYLMIVLMFIFRYLRSYEVLQYRLKASRMHFLLYILGIEMMPLLLLYKLVILFVNKNL